MQNVTPYILFLIAATALIAAAGSVLLFREESRYKKLLKAHQDLSARAALLEDLAESADEGVPQAVITVDPRGLIRGCNSAASELFGYRPEEIRGCSIFELVPLEHENNGAAGGLSEQRVEVLHKDGTAVPVWMRVTRMGMDDQDRFRFFFEDEEARSDQLRLQGENQTLRTALDSTGLAVALLDPQGRVLRLSKACADLLEISTAHAGTRLFWEVLHRPEDWGSARSAFEQARSGSAATLPKTLWISRTQRMIPLDWLTLKPSFNGSGELVHVIAIAAPAAERAGEPGQQHDLKIIGRVVGRVAGHLENLLSTINGYSELVLHEMAASHPLRKDVEQIFTAGQTASRSMHELLTFSGNRFILLEPLDLNALIKQANSRLKARLALCAGSTFVPGYREAFEDALLTLAEYSGGRLTIATDLDPGGNVTLKVSLGKTLEPEVLAHLFEPFHPASHAAGQSPAGMAMVYGIFRSCGGGISLSQTAENGTTLEIFLPSAMEGKEEKAPARNAAAAPV